MRTLARILSIALLPHLVGCSDESKRRVQGILAVPDIPGAVGGSLHAPRRAHAMTTVGGDMVLVSGGEALCVPSVGQFVLFTGSPDGSTVALATDSAAYSLSTSLPIPNKLADVRANALTVSRAGHVAIAGENGVLIFGGQDQRGSALESLEIFDVDAEYDVVGDSIIRIEGIGSNTTLASIVTPDSVTPVCLNYESAIAMPEFPVDPAAEICSQQLVPAMTFTDVNDPTDSYDRHGLLSRRRGGQYVLRDFDTGRVFANRAKATGDVTIAPLEFEGLDPAFQHFYSYTQDTIPLGDTNIMLVFGTGAYSDPLGQRTVTQPVLQTDIVAVRPDGTTQEPFEGLELDDVVLAGDGRIFPK